MPISIDELRDYKGGDPEKWRQSQIKRFADPGTVDAVIETDEAWRKLVAEVDVANKGVNKVQKQITVKKKAKEDAAELVVELKALKASIPAMKAELARLEVLRAKQLRVIGNFVDPTVPVSDNEDNNVVVSSWGGKARPHGLPADAEVLHHHELLAMIGGYEPERGSAVAGARGYFLRGAGVQLNMALLNYGATFLRARSYDAVQPPFFMRKDVMGGVAQLDDFDDQLYKVVGRSPAVGEAAAPAAAAGKGGPGDTGGDAKYLIATSEQPICAMHQNEFFIPAQLPVKYAGVSTCFRKEAGKAGKDVWGIFRVHQFDKVEQFVICEPEHSAAEHERMRETAEEFYKTLGIPYEVVNIVSAELNSAAAKKYDLEGWFPGYGEHKELVSASNCTDYQSRAMEIRLGHEKAADGSRKYVHMLNATLCACTRTICAILENWQTPTGIVVPPALVPFCGGVEFFPFLHPKPEMKLTGKAAKKAAAAAKKAKKEAEAAKKAAAATAPPAEAATPPTAAAGVPAEAAPVGSVLDSDARPSLGGVDGQKALDGLLTNYSFVDGYRPTAEDEAVAASLTTALAGAGLSAPDKASLPNVARWYATVQAHSDAERAAWPATDKQVAAGTRLSLLFK